MNNGGIITMDEDILTDKDISKMVCDVCGMTGVKLKNMKHPKAWMDVRLKKDYTPLHICDTCSRMMILFMASNGNISIPVETIKKYFPNFHALNKDESTSIEDSKLDTVIKEDDE
jgi:ssDNA-binding Zn-finger/Zn-ribbon topoisomerase 1